jgi:hypothetical protein
LERQQAAEAEMSDKELVKRLRKRQEFESIDGYKRIEWKDEDALEAADRIEELEDNLAKAVRGLNAICVWGEDTYARDMARTTLAEIEGE